MDVVAPELDGDGSSDQFKGEHNEPAESVLPTDGEAPGFVDEPASVGEEGTVDWVENREFTESLHSAKQHEAGDHEAEDEGGRTTGPQSATGTDEETSTDGTT